MSRASAPASASSASSEHGDTLRRALGLSRSQAEAILAIARDIAKADGPLVEERTASLLELLAQTLELPAGGGSEASVSSESTAREFPSPSQRRALIDGLIVVVCIEGEVRPARRRALEQLARALDVRSPFVDLLDALQHRRLLAIKRGLATRSPDARRIFRRVWQEEGVIGLFRVVWFLLGLHRDHALAERFHSLSSLPIGTFGRAVADHCAARSLAYPGERGGIPERMMHHDLMHVLNGYDTDPAGECEIAGFYCGFTDGEPYTFIVTALATFHLGLRVSPAIVEPARGAFDPRRVLAAFLRGRRLTVDVMGPWNYWALMDLPIQEVREHLGIGHRDPVAESPAVPVT